MLELMQDIFSI